MSYTKVLGVTVVPSADLASLTADVNLVYPNGIGKRLGLVVFEDAGSDVYHLMQSNGAAANSTWKPVGERTAADVASATVTPV